ncbi:MAG TPA: protease complex subunit PrcB family protein [Gemmatimonadales bacterium]|jgi:hypothetical protein
MIRLAVTLAVMAAAGVIVHDAIEIGHSATSGWHRPGLVIAGDSAAMQAGWRTLFAGGGTVAPSRNISLRLNRVAFVAAGDQRSGGFRFALTGYRTRHDSLLLEVTLTTPAPGCSVTQEITSPAIAVSVAGRTAPIGVISHERADTTRCH